MHAFSVLIQALNTSNKTSDKVQALQQFFSEAPDPDKVWALALFNHRRPKRQVPTALLRTWCYEVAQIPPWLFEESYQVVGDLAETITLLLPLQAQTQTERSLAEWIQALNAIRPQPEEEKKTFILQAWAQLAKTDCFVFNKLITGGFRVGVSANLVAQAVAKTFQLEKAEVVHRLMGDWDPDRISFEDLILAPKAADALSKPYPFFLAHPLEEDPAQLGSPEDFLIEWKWDGIRGQLIKREGLISLWSRGEELISDKFPEILQMAEGLPDGTVLDGEILAFAQGAPLPFSLLQTRIGRKTVSKKLLKEAPVAFMAYDLLEAAGQELRSRPLAERRAQLEALHAAHPSAHFPLSRLVQGSDWEAIDRLRQEARSYLAEGFMLKRKDSAYETGRKRGSWWKWKVAPLTIDGVLLYAQKGHGRRADLYSDYTLAVWQGENLVPFAKAYSGLTDAEMREVDRFVKKNTRERFGPVRTVKPELVFEIAFEGIQESPRHKSGIALRFPRIQRWRRDKPKEEANTLEDLQALLAHYQEADAPPPGKP
ncbi:ATP dependent DNA ligase [Nitritalea halalkaliphila LW7]|uniref:DNA ligase (ATP) n=1 Tax=Nitritalea halalkaliphila LW7 TaxID=1189621 RepID=I5C9N8_9BACT|nr:ATP-dependent DNA ligase [Nitritalea halalkaliphila]EIM78540.1 ATP dependent DNA ligase [Nitritalea halalkaliphila LW7]